MARAIALPALRRAALLIAAAACVPAAQADPFARMTPTPLAPSALDALRGGFDIAPGLSASFGIERSTSINGALVVSQSIQIPDLSRISADQASQLHAMLSGTTVVRNGPGNAVAPLTTGALAGATVIQNSLDGQAIKSLTVINATTNSLGALQALNAAASLRSALIAPLVSRP